MGKILINQNSKVTPAREPPQETSRHEKGQSLIEFTFTLVIMLILLAGISDLGRALFIYMTLRDAAQEGALYASIKPTDLTAIASRVTSSSNLVQDLAAGGEEEESGMAFMAEMEASEGEEHPSALTIDVSHLGAACSGNGVEVRVTYHEFPISMPFLGGLLGTQRVRISASVVDTILSPPCGS